MHSYKSLSFFQVSTHFSESATLNGSTHLLNFKIVLTWVKTTSKAGSGFLHVHLGHMQPKSWLQDYVITSRSATLVVVLVPKSCMHSTHFAVPVIKHMLDKHVIQNLTACW